MTENGQSIVSLITKMNMLVWIRQGTETWYLKRKYLILLWFHLHMSICTHYYKCYFTSCNLDIIRFHFQIVFSGGVFASLTNYIHFLKMYRNMSCAFFFIFYNIHRHIFICRWANTNQIELGKSPVENNEPHLPSIYEWNTVFNLTII